VAVDERQKDWYKIVQDREGEILPLYTRQDKDKDLYYLAEYKMKQQDGQEVPKDRVHNVTLNDPALFAWRANAILSAAFQQLLVEGKSLSDADTSYIEDLLWALYYEIDTRLGNLGIVGLFPFCVEQANIRGRISARCVFWRKGEKTLIPDVMPWDARFVAYQNDPNGLKWISYKTERLKDNIIAEYPDAEEHIRSNAETVLDIYTRKRNYVYIGEYQFKNRSHPFGDFNNGQGEVPAIYQIVPAGSMLADSDAISHEGESILALDRNIWPELNKAVSVLQTLNMMTFLPAMQYESEGGAGATLPDKPPYGVGAVTAVDKGMGFKMMPLEDIRNATRHLLAMLEGRAQRGSLPNVDYGNLTFPLSAVAIARLTESKDQIFVPRLQALSMFYQRLSRMMIRQYAMKGMEVEFGEEGHKKTYSPAKLNGDYTIKFRYYSQSPEQVIANYTVGAAAHQIGVSQHTIFTDILKLPDPMGEILKRRGEDAEEMDPILKAYNHVHALIDAGHDLQAKLLAYTVVQQIKARKMQMAQQTQPPVPVGGGGGRAAISAAKGLIPLLNEGGGGIRRGASDELEASEAMARDEEKRGQMAEIMRTRRETEGGVD